MIHSSPEAKSENPRGLYILSSDMYYAQNIPSWKGFNCVFTIRANALWYIYKAQFFLWNPIAFFFPQNPLTLSHAVSVADLS